MLRTSFQAAMIATACFSVVQVTATRAAAEDAYFAIPVAKLKITKGAWPGRGAGGSGDWNWQRAAVMVPYAVLDGPGEAYLGLSVGREWSRGRAPDRSTDTVNSNGANGWQNGIAIRVPKPRTVTGTLYLPNADFSGMKQLRFRVEKSQATNAARRAFYRTKSSYYAELRNLDIPGSAWFRQQSALAHSKATGKKTLEPTSSASRATPGRLRRSELEGTFDVFSGGQAISENLQLDRLLRSTKPGPPGIDINTLPGITVAEMDWSKLTKGIKPELDPLANLIPHDQHAVFFPSFRAMTNLMDEADAVGTPLLHLVQSGAASARSKERYQTQLCLEVSAVSRLLGPKFIRSVAFTGSDPYLATGSDVAVLFEAKSPTLLKQFLLSKHIAAAKLHADCKRVKGKIGDVSYLGAVSPNRVICSYIATLGNAVVVTNSLAQLERLAETRNDKEKPLAKLPEYRFFRHRYPRSDKRESGFLIVTDATIRRWCGPKWRIANSRRTRAAAIMSHYQATHLPEIVAGVSKSKRIETKLYVPDLGHLNLTKQGVISTEYGSLRFLKPIVELELDRVTEAEAKAYKRWRDNYQSYWRQFFDPIAVRFSVDKQRVAADVSVMPLIQQSDYRDMIRLTNGAKIKPDSGDRHAGSLLHWTLAINPTSDAVKQRVRWFLPINPLTWLGESISVYVDPDPVWLEFAKAKDKDRFLQRNFFRLPVAFQAEVKSPVKLALFLTGIRTYIDKAAPGLVVWKTKKHKGRPYVMLAATDPLKKMVADKPKGLALFYYATAKSFTVTLNENVLKRAIERNIAKSKPGQAKRSASKLKPWLGSSTALQFDVKALAFFESYFGDDYEQMMQRRAWANLPALNEWKRRYPKRDPVRMHREHWGIELRCPGGGKYVWSEAWQTMASTEYGHPGAPKSGPKFPAVVRQIGSANFGLTFEHKGLRARMELQRQRPRQEKVSRKR